MVVSLAVLLTAVGAVAQLSVQEQKCVYKLDRRTWRVRSIQGKTNRGCVNHYLLGQIGSAEGCTLSRRKSLLAAQAKLVSDEQKYCATAPPFGATDGAAAADAAYQMGVSLMHDLFSTPLDPALLRCSAYPAECRCQQQVVDEIEKLYAAMSRTFFLCLRAALAVGREPFRDGAADAADLARCIDDAGVARSVESDPSGQIAAGRRRLGDAVAGLCFTTANDEFALGVCQSFAGDPSGLSACLLDQVECSLCHLYKEVHDLGAAIDCQAWSGAPACAP